MKNFEKINSKDNFNFGYKDNFGKYPLFHRSLLDTINIDNINLFTELLYKYSDHPIIKYLLGPILNITDIPMELLSKYYLRFYTCESRFYKDINKEFRENYNLYFLPFVKVLYEGLKLKSVLLTNCNFLYGCGMLSSKEILKMKEYLKESMKKELPAIIISKTFLSLSKDKSIAYLFFENIINKNDDLKNVFYIIEKNGVDSDLSTYADLSKISIFPNEQEVLFFPFSAFAINDIIKTKNNKETLYEIRLEYLGDIFKKEK